MENMENIGHTGNMENFRNIGNVGDIGNVGNQENIRTNTIIHNSFFCTNRVLWIPRDLVSRDIEWSCITGRPVTSQLAAGSDTRVTAGCWKWHTRHSWLLEVTHTHVTAAVAKTGMGYEINIPDTSWVRSLNSFWKFIRKLFSGSN